MLYGVGGQLVYLLEDGVGVGKRCLELLSKNLLVEHVLDAQSGAVHFVHISGTDATLGRTDEVFAETLFVCAVEVLVIRHHDVRVTGNLECITTYALSLEGVDFPKEDFGVHDAAIADDGNGSLVHYATRHLVQRKALISGNNGVTSVRTAGRAAHHVEVCGDEVGYLALSLVAPLGSH